VNAYGVILTIVVLVAIAVAILLFEKKRAKDIEHDLGEMAHGKPKRRPERQGD